MLLEHVLGPGAVPDAADQAVNKAARAANSPLLRISTPNSGPHIWLHWKKKNLRAEMLIARPFIPGRGPGICISQAPREPPGQEDFRQKHKNNASALAALQRLTEYVLRGTFRRGLFSKY